MTKKKQEQDPITPEEEALEIEEEMPQEAEQQAEAELQDAAQQLAEVTVQRDEYLNLAQRVQADFENFKRRNQSVRADAFDEGKREVVIDMLPVLDNLERALLAAQQEEGTSPLEDGVELVHKQWMDLFQKLGVTEIDCYGKPFDPEEANAVMQSPREDMEPGTVCDVMQKGYRMGDRVLRYAMVQVASEA